MTVTWLDGIGPPLEQLREDCEGGSGLDARDGLALLAEVIRLRALSTEDAKRPTPISEPAFGTVAEYDAWVADMDATRPTGDRQ